MLDGCCKKQHPLEWKEIFVRNKPCYQKVYNRTSLEIQWLRICLPMQETQVQSLVQEDPTCCRTTKPECHNHRSLHALEPELCNKEEPPLREA